MVTWTYKGTPDADYDRPAPDHTVYSADVLVMVKFVGSKDPYEPRMAHYVWYERSKTHYYGTNHWSIDGLSGTTHVLCWSEINIPTDEDINHRSKEAQ